MKYDSWEAYATEGFPMKRCGLRDDHMPALNIRCLDGLAIVAATAKAATGCLWMR
jgi:hypothetical protein